MACMLLDLPAETLRQILATFVQEVDIGDSWRARSTCKDFATIIEEEILAKKPITAFLKKNGKGARGILRAKIDDYIAYKSLSRTYRQGAHEVLPEFIEARVTELIDPNGGDTHGTRKEFAFLLSRLLARTFEDSFRLSTISSSSSTGQQLTTNLNRDDPTHRIAAVAATGRVHLMNNTAWGTWENAWRYSSAFGYPLAAATFAGQRKLVRYMAQRHRAQYPFVGPADREKAFHKAVTIAFEMKEYASAQVLLHVLCQCFPIQKRGKFREWLFEAVKSGQPTLVSETLNIKSQGDMDDIIGAFESACEQGNADIVRLFFVHGCLNVNQRFGYARARYPLLTAVESGHAAVAQTLLDLGAVADGISFGPFDSALFVETTRRGSTRILRLLLPRTRNFHLISRWWFHNHQSDLVDIDYIPDANEPLRGIWRWHFKD